MTPDRIEKIAREAHEMDGTLREAFIWAIITAINETKEEDSRLAWKAMGHDAAEAILASKIKESV